MWHVGLSSTISLSCPPEDTPNPTASPKGAYNVGKESVCHAKTISSPHATRLLPLRSSHVGILELTLHTVLDLTRFCTMHILSLLSSATSPYISTKSWSFICCVKWSRAINTPVLPTPALRKEWNYMKIIQQKVVRVEGDEENELW